MTHVKQVLPHMVTREEAEAAFYDATQRRGTRCTCHSYVWHDSRMCVTWHVWHDSCICVKWLMHMCDMTHSHVWRDSFICVTWLIHMCDSTHSYVWQDSFICVTGRIHRCDMTHSFHIPTTPPSGVALGASDMTYWYVSHASFIRVTWNIHMSHSIVILCIIFIWSIV